MANVTGPSGLDREELEATCADIGRTIGGVVPKGVGFAFLLFDFGSEGNFAYLSNAKREDMLNMFREAIEKLEADR